MSLLIASFYSDVSKFQPLYRHQLTIANFYQIDEHIMKTNTLWGPSLDSRPILLSAWKLLIWPLYCSYSIIEECQTYLPSNIWGTSRDVNQMFITYTVPNNNYVTGQVGALFGTSVVLDPSCDVLLDKLGWIASVYMKKQQDIMWKMEAFLFKFSSLFKTGLKKSGGVLLQSLMKLKKVVSNGCMAAQRTNGDFTSFKEFHVPWHAPSWTQCSCEFLYAPCTWWGP